MSKSYSDLIHEFQNLHQIEEVPNEELVKKDSEVNFLSHHCVHKEDSTTTKLRVVFDGSAQSSTGVSLNGSLMVGPTVQTDLFSSSLDFVSIKLRIQQTLLNCIDKLPWNQLQRIFTASFGTTQSPIQYKFRMTRVTYGIASSAFHSTRSVVEVGIRC